jgi:hypothetical protein
VASSFEVAGLRVKVRPDSNAAFQEKQVTTQVDRLKEKTPACAAAAGKLAGDCVMDDHYCPSAFSLQPKHLSSYKSNSYLQGRV